MSPLLSSALSGMRRNLLPGVILWSLGLALVWAYYRAPVALPWFQTVAQWRDAGGFLFSAGASAICGGLIPWLFLFALGRLPPGRRLAELAFLVLFWVYRGVEVDAFYRLQGVVWGDGTDAATVVPKVATDMLIYTALWSIPTTTLIYAWWDEAGRDWRRFTALLTPAMFTLRIPSVVIAAWMVWTPTVAIVYSLPPLLQIPLFNVVLVFWVLLVAVVAAPAPSSGAAGPPHPTKGDQG